MCNCKQTPITFSRKDNLLDKTLDKLPTWVLLIAFDLGYKPPEPIVELCKHDQKLFDSYIAEQEFLNKYKY